jgi:CheY-like chemotaxis protein
MLPDTNGIEVLRAIRRRELPVRVAVVTALQDPHVIRQVRELRPDVVLRKPIELSELRRWLHSVEQDDANSA